MPADIEGAVDLHAHCGPYDFERRFDGVEAARRAADAGMDGIVLKSHLLPTAAATHYIEELLELEDYEIEVFGSVALNHVVGGYNPWMVRTAIEFGAAVIWVPTIHADNQIAHDGTVAVPGKGTAPPDGQTGLNALTKDGDLTQAASACLDEVVRGDVIIGIGHPRFEEAREMVQYLSERDHEKIIIDHPLFPATNYDLEHQRQLVDLGATINLVYNSISSLWQWRSPESVYENIRTIGIENCVISSDVGSHGHPSHPEALQLMGEILREQGLSTDEYMTMIETNPKRLLGQFSD